LISSESDSIALRFHAFADEIKAEAAEAPCATARGSGDRRRGTDGEVLGTGDLTIEETRKGCASGRPGDLAPCFCCSALDNHGVRRCSTRSSTFCPRRSTSSLRLVRPPKRGGDREIRPTAGPVAAMAFKTLSDATSRRPVPLPYLFRRIEPGKDVFNMTRQRPERSVRSIRSSARAERMPRGVAGDIRGGREAQGDTYGDTLTEKAHPVLLRRPVPGSVTAECIRAKNKGDEEKMAQGLNRLHEEDPTLSRHYEPRRKETLVYGMGDLQLE